MKSVIVVTRPAKRGGVHARAGRGRKAKVATRRHAGLYSAIRAAAYKFFRMDSSNVQTAADITVEPAMCKRAYAEHDPVRSQTHYIATLPDLKGGL